LKYTKITTNWSSLGKWSENEEEEWKTSGDKRWGKKSPSHHNEWNWSYLHIANLLTDNVDFVSHCMIVL